MSWLWKLYPLCSRACWYGVAARSKDSLSDEVSESRLLIDSGSFLIITGGWLDIVWIYKDVLFDFVYGSCTMDDDFRLIQERRKGGGGSNFQEKFLLHGGA